MRAHGWHCGPTDGNRGVTFVVDVDFPRALPIVTDITVLDDAPLDTVHLENASDL